MGELVLELDADIKRARSNLVLLDSDNIPAAQDTIKQLERQRDELKLEVRHEPTEQDINEQVRQVFRTIVLLGSTRPEGREAIKAILPAIASISVFVKISPTTCG